MSDNSPIRLLLIEDDPGVAGTVREGLTARRFLVSCATTLAAGRRVLSSRRFDAVVLDLTLPDGNGLDLAAELRSADADLPLLMLTAKDSIPDRVAGFSHGADDYLCKPFDVEELAARLFAILRRAHSGERHILRYRDLHLQLVTHTVRRKEITVTLSARETELLAFLMRHAEEVLPRDRVLREVWGDDAEADSNVLNVYVNYLRNKTEAGLHPRLIHTVRRIGYMLSEKEPEELLAQASASE